MSKLQNLWGNLTNASDIEIYGLQYIGGYVILELDKNFKNTRLEAPAL